LHKILIFLLLVSFVHADQENAKAVYDLTTKNLITFEKKILKGIVAQKSYFNGQFKELDVAVIIHGGAYRFFVKDLKHTIYRDDTKLIAKYSELKKRIASLADNYNVKFYICGVGLKHRHLAHNNILPYVKIIPNATIGLIEKQNDGYAYLPVKD